MERETVREEGRQTETNRKGERARQRDRASDAPARAHLLKLLGLGEARVGGRQLLVQHRVRQAPQRLPAPRPQSQR